MNLKHVSAVAMAAAMVVIGGCSSSNEGQFDPRSMGDLNLRQALVMGFAQALALAPGVSRSGITITAGRFMKLDRDSAARVGGLQLQARG